MKNAYAILLLFIFCLAIPLFKPCIGFTSGMSEGISMPSVSSQKNLISKYIVENKANKESTKRTVFILFNHGKRSIEWGFNWFLRHDYGWGKAVNDFLKQYNEIIAMVLSAIVFFFEFAFNFLVYYLIGTIVMMYGLIVAIIGIILIPLIAIWNFFLWLINLF